jgi:hypothetical protein
MSDAAMDASVVVSNEGQGRRWCLLRLMGCERGRKLWWIALAARASR